MTAKPLGFWVTLCELYLIYFYLDVNIFPIYIKGTGTQVPLLHFLQISD